MPTLSNPFFSGGMAGLSRSEGKHTAAEGILHEKRGSLVHLVCGKERKSPRNPFREMKLIRSSRLSQVQARSLDYRKKIVKVVAEN